MKLEERQNIYANAVSRMIQIETIHRPQGDGDKFFRFQSLLAELVPHVFTTCEKWTFDGSLLLRWKGKNPNRAVILMSHQDVVEAPGKWKYPPFSGTIAEGKIWGRGALDIKGNLYCILRAVEELMQEGFEPACDVYIASSHEEETGGNDYIVDFLRGRGVQLEFLVDEGGGIKPCPVPGSDRYFAVISIAEKGNITMKCTARGRGGHASHPGRWTPLPRLGAFMAAFEEDGIFTVKMNKACEAAFRKLAMTIEDPTQAAYLLSLANEEPGWKETLTDQLRSMMRTTIAFTMAHGSETYNVLPQEAYVICNSRVALGETVTETVNKIREVAGRYQVEVEVLHADEPTPVVDPNGEAFRRVEKAIQTVWPGMDVIPFLLEGATDTKHYVPICPNCIRFSCLKADASQRSRAHGIDENIDVAALPKGIEIFKALIREL